MLNVATLQATHIKILVESGIDNTTTSSNISTIPITILTTILYTSKIYIFLNHNTGTILVYNTGTNLYTSIVHNTSIPVLRSPSTGDPIHGYIYDCRANDFLTMVSNVKPLRVSVT